VLVERVEGFCSEAEWSRSYDEINAFESQQIEAGTNIVKLFVHVTQKEQDKQLAQRLNDPWKRWKTGADDYRNRSHRAEYLNAMQDMFEHCNTHWSPWIVIDGNDRKAARIAAITTIVERMESFIPMDMPDADPAVIELARQAFDYKEK
jgi:polyphosphate kinase 2 (PPK2 family)